MEIQEALAQTQAELKKAGVPEQWQESWGREVLKHLLAGRPLLAPQLAAQAPVTASGAAADSGLGRLAARFAVSETALADVFEVQDEGVTLHVASARISATKSKATREVALLVVSARQGAGIDDSWTDVSYVRDSLAQYNRYDQSNFSKYLGGTDDVFNFRGKPVQQLRLTRPGWEAAEELIKAITGSA